MQCWNCLLADNKLFSCENWFLELKPGLATDQVLSISAGIEESEVSLNKVSNMVFLIRTFAGETHF